MQVEREGPVAVVTLDNPEALNALTDEMMRELGDLWPRLAEDSAVRAVVLTGAGDRAFCSGVDAQTLRRDASDRRQSPPRFTNRQTGFWKPVIAAVNGVCAGGGLHFVADADIVIASERASFVDPHINVGQVSALEPIALARKIPLDAVLRMVVLGRAERLDAQAALRIGLVGEVVSPDHLIERALELGRAASAGSPRAVQRSLQAIWQSLDRGLEEGLQQGWELLKEHQSHPDSQEGGRAFLEKRDPRWRD